MRKWLFVSAVLVMVPTAANAATWIASCSDGQRLQYNQTVNGNGLLYLGANSGGVGLTQMAVLKQISLTDTKICGAVNGNPTVTGGVPLSQLCADKLKKEITIKWQSPAPGTTMKEGHFCAATVTIN